MSERRSLTEGLRATPAVDPAIAREFVHGQKPKVPELSGSAAMVVAERSVTTHSRLPISTRIREDYAKALKRASLERQLQGIVPSTLQDILEQALEPWLKAHGYIQ